MLAGFTGGKPSAERPKGGAVHFETDKSVSCER
jgi:hypothetical protein